MSNHLFHLNIYVCSIHLLYITRLKGHRDFFSVRLLSVLRGHSVFSSPPQRPMTSDFEGFSIPDFIHYSYFPILILEKEPVFPVLMFSAKQGKLPGTIFTTSLVWRGSWLGIEPEISRTRCQHYRTRLSRRRYSGLTIGKQLISILTLTAPVWHVLTIDVCLSNSL